jgi:8-oxo-dGTP pyrophosphatase MutT (NUDIX family)
MDRTGLTDQINKYSSSFKEEELFRIEFLELLTQARCFHRDHLPGHITGSSWIVNPERTKVLLVHHAKLNRWLQPGGHADGEENVVNVALREAEEETGVTGFKIIKQNIYDLDIHVIPARKDFPEHLHYDIRFLMEADEQLPIIVSEESHDVKWILLKELHQFNDETSILRLRDKLKLL